jgi:putative flippase GtrA
MTMMLLLFVLQSPYNTSNPHFGYPAYVPPSSLDPSGTPRSRFPRRRKRDLVRTLTYLAALRFLALHRSIQHRLNVLVAVLLRLTGLGWWNRWWRQGAAGRCRNAAAAAAASGSEQHRDGSDKKVHWTTSSAASSSPDTVAPPPPPTSLGRCPVAHSPHHRSHHLHHQHLSSALASSSSSSPTPPPPSLIDVDPSVLYLMLLFIIVRTPDRKDKVKRLVRFLVVGVPTWSAAQARRLALRVLVGKARADALLNAERASQ